MKSINTLILSNALYILIITGKEEGN